MYNNMQTIKTLKIDAETLTYLLRKDNVMKLMTKAIEKKIPKLYETENINEEDKIAYVKYFNPCGIGTWYGLEYNPKDRLFFGYVELHEKEYGYFSLDELESINLPYGLKIERDLYFEPTKMADIIGSEL